MPEPTLLQGLTLIGFGAAIGFVPSYLTARTQAGFQRKQLVLERRLAALLDFSKIVINGAGVLQRCDEFGRDAEWGIDDDSRARILMKMIDLKTVTDRWHAEICAHLTVVHALFDIQTQVVGFAQVGRPDVETAKAAPQKEFESIVKVFLDKAEKEVHEIMETMQQQITELAQRLN